MKSELSFQTIRSHLRFQRQIASSSFANSKLAEPELSNSRLTKSGFANSEFADWKSAIPGIELRTRKPGLTLVEVLVATALLATLLVGMLTMFNSHQKQLLRADKIREGVEALDSVLSVWYSDPNKIPKLESMPMAGDCPLYDQYIWHSSVQQASSLPDAYIVRVSVFNRNESNQPVTHCDLIFSGER